MKPIAGFLILSAISCVVGFAVWRFHGDEPTQFRAVAVERGKVIVVVSASGTIEPEEIVDVGALVAGRIKSIGTDPDDPAKTIDYGSRVQEGTVLARMDDSAFQAKVDQMQADVKKAEAELAAARARLARADNDRRRAEELKQTLSEADYDGAVASYEMAKAEVAVAEATVLQAEARLKQAQIDLGHATITSPIAGVVIDRRVNVGQTLAEGLEGPGLFLLAADLGRLEIWASVNEADIGMIRLGQPVDFTVDAYPDRTFTGEVTQIRLNASMTQNVVSYTVIVACENPEGRLLPYMTASLRFEVARRDDVLVVPNRALRWRPAVKQLAPEYRDRLFEIVSQDPSAVRPEPEGNGGSKPNPGVVWLQTPEGFLRPVHVQIGLTDGLRSELITDDLREGARLVIGEVNTQTDVGDFTSTFVRLPKGE